jgi:hypothetical protein
MAAHLSVRQQGPVGRRGDGSRLPAGGCSSCNMEEAGQCTAGRSKVRGRATWRRDATGDQQVGISSVTPPPLQVRSGPLLPTVKSIWPTTISPFMSDLSARNGVSAWFLSSQEVGMVAMDKDGALHLLPFQQIPC